MDTTQKAPILRDRILELLRSRSEPVGTPEILEALLPNVLFRQRSRGMIHTAMKALLIKGLIRRTGYKRLPGQTNPQAMWQVV